MLVLVLGSEASGVPVWTVDGKCLYVVGLEGLCREFYLN